MGGYEFETKIDNDLKMVNDLEDYVALKKKWKTMLDNIKIMLYNQFCC